MNHLAKITRPRLGRVAERERLFSALDEARKHALTWVSGPPGAGKTTLAASYVAARSVPTIWLRIDDGDADPATFFYYLREAAPDAHRAGLPLLTPECLFDLPGFARRFFRALYQCLGHGTAIVLDNFEQAAHALTAIVREAAQELPERMSLIAMSRESPPAELARLRAAQAVAAIGWDELRLTVEETEAIAVLHGKPAAAGTKLHERTGGWAAAVTLLIEQPEEHAAADAANAAGHAAVFDYFASEIFSRSPAELRKLWLSTAYLPRFTARMAERLCGNGDAARLLDDLCQRDYFTQRRSLSEPYYEYHALFRAFLAQQVERSTTEAQRQRLLRQSALVLAEDGDPDSALDLYRATGDRQSAAALILASAPATVAQGRWQTVARWIGELPGDTVRDAPWLLYWAGACRAQTDPPAGRATLEQAYSRFADAKNDTVGAAVCASAILETHFLEQTDFARLDRWMEVLDGVLSDRPAFPAAEMELRVWSSLLVGIRERHVDHYLAGTCADRVWTLCRSAAIPAGQRLLAASVLTGYLGRVDDGTQGPAAVAEFTPLADSPGVTPLQRVLWKWNQLFPLLRMLSRPQDFEQLRSALAEAADIAHQNGLQFIEPCVRRLSLWADLSAGDLETSERLIDELQRSLPVLRPLDEALDHFLRAWLALLQERPRTAVQHSEAAVRITRQLGTGAQLLASLGFHSQALAECGELERALEAARECTAWAPKAGGGLDRFSALAYEADALRRLGRRDEFLECLRDTFAAGRQGGCLCTMTWLPKMMARLCAEALAAGIETEFVESLIEKRGLLPERPDVEHWPWPVRIYTLGRFSLVLRGVPARFAAKAPRKALELLQALIAFGGRDVAIAHLSEALWPDDEGDAAHNSFDNALHRLRKLVGRDDALLVRKGSLSLNDRVCWCDAWAFEHGALAPQEGGSDGDGEAVNAIALYRGNFLARETDARWALGYREKLRNRLLRVIDSLAERYEGANRVDEQVSLYQRGLEIDDTAERFYQRLMLAHLRRGERGEALSTYRRCVETLSAALGTSPSAVTEAIHQRIRAA